MSKQSTEDIELDSSPSNKKMVNETGKEEVSYLLDEEEEDTEVEKRGVRTEEMDEEDPGDG